MCQDIYDPYMMFSIQFHFNLSNAVNFALQYRRCKLAKTFSPRSIVPYGCLSSYRCDLRNVAAPRLQFVTDSPWNRVSRTRNGVFLWRRGVQCAEACTGCTRYSSTEAFAAGRTLMTLMRLFWRLAIQASSSLCTSLHGTHSVTAVPGSNCRRSVWPRSLSPNCAGFLVKHEHPISRSCPNNASTTWPTRAFGALLHISPPDPLLRRLFYRVLMRGHYFLQKWWWWWPRVCVSLIKCFMH